MFFTNDPLICSRKMRGHLISSVGIEPLNLKITIDWLHLYNHGCQAGSILHKLSSELAIEISSPTLLSPSSIEASDCSLPMIELTALFTSVTNWSLNMQRYVEIVKYIYVYVRNKPGHIRWN